MILTGNEITKELHNGRIYIEPFDEKYIEQNSYGFHLGSELLQYETDIDHPIDVHNKIEYSKLMIAEEGLILQQGKFYLGFTTEKMGSDFYAQTLHANFSVSSMGMWIQFSAPLGHIGAIINWTLEIMVAQPIKVYPNMKIGKIAFWKNTGNVIQYNGRYLNSTSAIPSRIKEDFINNISEGVL